MSRANRVLLLVVVFVLYIEGPLIAGVFGIGDRDGPKIYPRAYHEALYMISYEEVCGEKPRSHGELCGGGRPFFYGLPRTGLSSRSPCML